MTPVRTAKAKTSTATSEGNLKPTIGLEIATEKPRDPAELVPMIPVHALIDALESATGRTGKYRRMTGERVRAAARKQLSGEAVTKLFEDWRYGQRIPFTLSLLLKQQLAPVRVPESLHKALDDAGEDADPIFVLGEDRFGSGPVIEVAFRYGHTFDYLDIKEREQSATESRYGFLWIDTTEQFVAVTGEDKIVERILKAMESVLGQRPIRIAFDRTVVDDNFDFEKIWSVASYDQWTQIRYRYAGEGLARHQREFDEIKARDQGTLRTRALYAEEINGKSVRASVAPLAGRLVTTVALPAPLLRAWAHPKLREIARSQRELQKSQPMRFYQLSNALQLPEVAETSASIVRELVPAVIECRKRGLTSVRLPDTNALVVAATLPEKAGRVRFRAECAGCGGELVPLWCSACGAEDVTRPRRPLACVASPAHTTFVCANGHDRAASGLERDLTFEPSHVLLQWISVGLSELSAQSIDPTAETLFVRGDQLHYQKRDLLPSGAYTCLVIDIEKSTSFRRADEGAYVILRKALRRSLETHAAALAGRTAGDRGDGGLAVFTKASDALTTARAIRDEMAAAAENPHRRNIRFGLVTGNINSGVDLLDGLVLHLGERIQGTAAAPGWISLDTRTLMGVAPADKALVEDAGAISTLKGFEEAPGRYYRLA